ncbi:YjbF family lipoprotein [Shewanella avicenniae]|uniref:YjbF family lipoprotein n=1 Tax=Shewanella avicenniae TaxID=2814294 RepID=A0ABX7QRQ9_9GAMM|nr:YjbF family lipoprotein [Shewanella avicenniae]QSX33626.1 YjbF family lipoprotein [Shewanella avicenniae]
MAYQTFKDAISDPPSYEISASDLANIPYATIYGQLGDGPQAVIVLAYAKGDQRQWLTAQKESLITAHGRLIQTAGLSQNLAGLTFETADPLTLPLTQLDGAVASGYLDLLPSYRFGMKFDSRFVVKRREQVQLGPNTQELTLIEETFTIPEVHYQVVNKYWLDDRGLVWKSEQAPSPDLPVFRITLLKPFSGDLS